MQTYRYEIFTSIIENKIKKGILKPGTRLPSVREIKADYHLSISSIQSGYDLLVIKGLVKNVPRSGYYVASDVHQSISEPLLEPYAVAKNGAFNKNIALTSVRNKPSEYSSFNAATPTDLLIPQKLILRKMQEVIREKGASLLRYYPSNGLPELRSQIADRALQYGCRFNPEELIITDGALQALYIALASVTNAGDLIAVESPCVFSVLEVITNLKLKVLEIPIHGEDGFDTEHLKKVSAANDIKALVVTPNFHNPTGRLMTDNTKKELLSIAMDHQFPIIENDLYGDLYFGDERPSSIRNFDEYGWVMTFSSFSKTLAPGIRLGWLHSGRYHAKAERLRFSLGRSVAPIYQELLLKLLEDHSYSKHLRSFRKQLYDQARDVLEALRTSFPEGSYFEDPQGGYSIWGSLSKAVDMKMFYRYCDDQRILFTPGEIFSLTDQFSHHFRIVFADRITSHSLISLKNAGEKVKELL
ncbi:PLP-dependent aminotransferase family protein [Chryseobacterium sp. ISL-6]|uniref:aminotransferase-like domain-containing protein n=1 Tax=Chryseobacterium sp. ISL-6 TaxID=2819143 RepID=UPI001BEBFC1B|nr:PLP-dependent aminotransferase family protein [Chryseobacterium sp. ISL-6]MBT2622676.1 PLP-dependent aminotransferase family protein [Chryseobacterium sp. ISL-6]